MITHLRIANFKSIKQMEISCKKLNVFIGEPNSGKSNIVEAMALQSQNVIGKTLNQDIIRYKGIDELFYDFAINQKIEVETDQVKSVVSYYNQNEFNLFLNQEDKEASNPVRIQFDGKIVSHGALKLTKVHFYEYRRLQSFQPNYTPHLSVPFGENLPSLLKSNPELRKWVSEFILAKGLQLNIKPIENDIVVSKNVDGYLYSYPFFAISETLQRIIFYTVAIKSNHGAVLLLDEPESNTFPFYTKFLAECIALDETNQFFITTHNPYLLMSLIEKSKSTDLNVCIVGMKDYQTTVTVLNEGQISKVLDLNSDVFFNFDDILGE